MGKTLENSGLRISAEIRACLPPPRAFLCPLFPEAAAELAPRKAVYAYYYERHAEDLPHVEEHSLLECFLHVLYVFHEEAENEDGSEAPAEEEACADFFLVEAV